MMSVLVAFVTLLAAVISAVAGDAAQANAAAYPSHGYAYAQELRQPVAKTLVQPDHRCWPKQPEGPPAFVPPYTPPVEVQPVGPTVDVNAVSEAATQGPAAILGTILTLVAAGAGGVSAFVHAKHEDAEKAKDKAKKSKASNSEGK